MNRLKDVTIAFTGTIVRVALVILAAICIANYAGKAYEFGYRLFTEEPMSAPPGRDISIVVNSSDSQSDIIQMLEDKGIIRDHLLFTVQKKLSAYKKNIQPGSYTLNTSMNTDEILETLVGPLEEEEGSTADELTEVIDPVSDDITGLETAGVLGEDEQYDEAAAFAEDGTVGEYEGEGDEESAIEE